jgi:hypothetical protein
MVMSKVVSRHIAPPATARQISKGVGVTPSDAKLVRKVLRDLGYIKEEGTQKLCSPKSEKTPQKSR